MSGSREAILGTIRLALRDVPPDERAADVPVRRAYRHKADEAHEVLVDRFAERVADYQAEVRRVAAADVSAAVGALLVERRVGRVVVPRGLPEQWWPDGVEVVVDDGSLSTAELDAVDGALTGCAVGIAETGTFVLDGGGRSGRRAVSLVPDYFLCLVEVDQVVGSVPEAIGRLDPQRPLTFVSGPSATSDIELRRVEGVHGPRTLDVLIID
ncbi:MAG: LUD domain-containing protein [Actinomycetota bacterium]|nr:LUD domain-containing protein [Actinomycetota bacterium]